jgi:hypothetical protein
MRLMHLAPQTLGGFSDGFRSTGDGPFKAAQGSARDEAPESFDEGEPEAASEAEHSPAPG